MHGISISSARPARRACPAAAFQMADFRERRAPFSGLALFVCSRANHPLPELRPAEGGRAGRGRGQATGRRMGADRSPAKRTGARGPAGEGVEGEERVSTGNTWRLSLVRCRFRRGSGMLQARCEWQGKFAISFSSFFIEAIQVNLNMSYFDDSLSWFIFFISSSS